ncbi:MAG TPA: hypothetical protein EYP68_01405 [Candidatus Korarchaeota archaeon]|nr:hypothetical protein [Candidatus Korarchaeota archaeon]
MTYKDCDKPLNICIALNEFPNELIDRGVAERISPEEAEEILNIANEHGLVNQALYIDWLKGGVFNICSCSPCFCMYLRAFLNYGVKHHIVKSGFKSIIDPEKCTGCETYVESCIFNARSIVRGKCVVDEERCLWMWFMHHFLSHMSSDVCRGQSIKWL